MKKFLSIVGFSILTIVLSSGCSGLQMKAQVDKHDESMAKTAIYVGDANSEEMLKAIKAAGEKTGWRVTDFKTDAVIVEKVVDDKTMSSTIKFHHGHISGDNENASMDELLELRKAIVAELQSKARSH